MKRRLIQFGVLLLLGAVVNVAVAWGCCIASPYRGPFTGTKVEVQRLARFFGTDWADVAEWVQFSGLAYVDS